MAGAVGVDVIASDSGVRAELAGMLAGLCAWLAYTRVFWSLKTVHATIPACPFLMVTGHPCPLCGGTRSFAAMWRGDVATAARYHPLGPALFVATVAAVMVLAVLLASGRRLRLRLPRPLERSFYLGVAAAFTVSWTLKLVWLGN